MIEFYVNLYCIFLIKSDFAIIFQKNFTPLSKTAKLFKIIL
ncbi:hypothetical protein CHAB381_0521 [Campylobacter hominis ATCC BAA-381]|uniref:Uncharacterized protein n=1 Tax=Campylobacter hominis (strain ATCC BAA-381 / DSM 21671 / CCUG 45161 / LMG 19568 / NCTC 13146 / CH001A) TaxID=360107 RepID=A7I0R8_CAMHC|nr:hypothetical protein CHAB381_0521 [Campylobacter hominis ATCC BAA-381]